MIDLDHVWIAGRGRRWHTNPGLSWTDDYLDGHQGRVARWCLALNPTASWNLIVAALTHDDGEYGLGDIAKDAKVALQAQSPHLWAAIEAHEVLCREAVWGPALHLTDEEQLWLRLADRFDAYRWMLAHRRRLRKSPKWQADRRELLDLAAQLECYPQIAGVVL